MSFRRGEISDFLKSSEGAAENLLLFLAPADIQRLEPEVILESIQYVTVGLELLRTEQLTLRAFRRIKQPGQELAL